MHSVGYLTKVDSLKDKKEADRFHNMKDEEMLKLEDILETLKKDLIKRGALKQNEELSRFDLGMLLLSEYVKYPMPQDGIIPWNYCALPRLFPFMKNILFWCYEN